MIEIGANTGQKQEKIAAFPQFISDAERYKFLAQELRHIIIQQTEQSGDFLKVAELYRKMGDQKKADEIIWKQATESSDLYTQAHCLHKLGEGVEARGKYLEYLRQESPKAKKGRKHENTYGTTVWDEPIQGEWDKVAEAYDALGDKVSAKRAYLVAVDKATGDKDWNKLGGLYLKINEFEKAKEAFQKAAGNASQDLDKAKALEKAGKHEEAKKLYEGCLEELMDSIDSPLRLDIYEGLYRIHSGISVEEEVQALGKKDSTQKIEFIKEENNVSFAGIIRGYHPVPKDVSLVPTLDLVETDTVVRHLKRIAMGAESPKSSVLLQGPTGTGKSSLVMYYSKLINKEALLINMNGQTDITHLIGKYEVRGGQTEWVDGPLSSCLRHGYHAVLEEINMTIPDVLVRLNNLMDSNNALVLIERDNEVIKPHPDFRLFATMNPAGEYAGAKELNPAFKGRFTNVLFVDFLPKDEEMEILRSYAPTTAVQTLSRMQKVALKLRESYLKSDFDTLFSMRELINWSANVDKYNDHFSLRELGELAFINKIENSISRKAAEEIFNIEGIK